MYRILVAVVGLGMLAVSVPAAALGLGEAGELEAARANARAGGPISRRSDQWTRCGVVGAIRLPQRNG